jgi:hypothetical protein
MLDDGLFDKVLIEPVRDGADELRVVSGYATPGMAFNHLHTLREQKLSADIRLLVGMCPTEGLRMSQHLGFKRLVSEDFPKIFYCGYITNTPSVHSKVYLWMKQGKPFRGFIGSANYSQSAFSKWRREVMTQCNPESCLDYYDGLVGESIYCDHQDVESELVIYDDSQVEYTSRMGPMTEGIAEGETVAAYTGFPRVTLSFLSRDRLPQRSGLNWGQRPEYSREPNQAYIRVPADIARSDFFPSRAVKFTILTDDQKSMICARAQDGDKAIETPYNNSLLGTYFRSRLGLASGAPVSISDLRKYGRTDVDFYKIDDETYYMDFSVR